MSTKVGFCVVVAAIIVLIATANLPNDVEWVPDNAAILGSDDMPLSVWDLGFGSLPVPTALAATANPVIAPPAVAAALDQYGGRADRNCTRGATGRFYTERIEKQWFLCTPAGHPMWGQGVYVVGPQVWAPKYGSDANAFAVTAERLKGWGFNLLGTYADIFMEPWNNRVKLPTITLLRPGTYGMAGVARSDVFRPGTLDENIKDLSNGASPFFTRISYSGMPDWGDVARLRRALHYMLSDDPKPQSLAGAIRENRSLDYIVGIALEDSDQTSGFFTSGQNDPFDTQPSQKGAPHGGYMTAVMTPQEQANAVSGLIYAKDQKVYTKYALQSFLQKKYSSVEALNAAWGSNYTSFGSSASSITGESFGVTDGSSATYSHTLAASGTLTPNSIRVFQDGVLIAGDCFHPNRGDECNPQSGTTWGGIYGPTVTGGTVHYPAKAVTIYYARTFRYRGFPAAPELARVPARLQLPTMTIPRLASRSATLS